MSRLFKGLYGGKTNRVKQKIRQFYAHKAAAELIPDNDHIFTQRPKARFTVTIRHESGQSCSFRSYALPWGGLSISPTLAGQKVKTVLQNYL